MGDEENMIELKNEEQVTPQAPKTVWDETEEKEDSQFKTPYDIIRDYSEYSTFHGIIYIFFSYQTIFGRVFWSVSVFIMLVLGLYWTVTTYQDWQNRPVSSSITTTAYPIEKVEYPAFTICAPGMIWNVSNSGNYKLLLDHLDRINKSIDLNTYEVGQYLFANVSLLNAAEKKKYYLVQELLNSKEAKDWFTESFPGIDYEDNFNGLLNLMIARDPDSSLTTWGVNMLGDLKSQKDRAYTPCDDMFVFDASNEYCYLVLDKLDNNIDGSNTCISQFNAELIRFENDNEVSGFLKLLNSGALKLPPDSNGFFSLNAIRDRYFDFSFSRGIIVKKNFAKLKIVKDNSSHFCLLAKYEPQALTFNIYSTLCNDDNVIICRKNKHANTSTFEIPHSYLEYYLDPKFNKIRKLLVASETIKFKELFKKWDQTNSYKSLMGSVWYGTLPCYELRNVTSNIEGGTSFLSYCEWKGLPIICASIFKSFPTDKGMCCTFNMKAAEDIFNGKTYAKSITDMQNEDIRLSFLDTVPPKQYLKRKEPKSAAGRNKGLILTVDGHTGLVDAASSDSNYKGFLGLISPPGSYPYTVINGLDIQPGQNNIITLSGTSISSEEDLRNLEPIRRNCYFPDETETLTIHKNYSYYNCIFECNILYTKKALYENKVTNKSCMPWFFPSAEESIIVCDPWETKYFLDFMVNDIPDDACNYCLPDCSGTLYESFLTSTPVQKCLPMNFGISPQCNIDNQNNIQPFKYSDIIRKYYQEKPLNESKVYLDFYETITRKRDLSYFSTTSNTTYTSEPYNTYDEDIAIIQIYFKSASLIQIGRESRMSWVDFFSNVGGLLGLVLGLGILSLVELVWLCLRLAAQKLQLTDWVP